jgi:Ca2+-binding EF-hand superfamily protein
MFLGRLDTNGNGMIDPSETQGRAAFFLDRIRGQVPELDFSRPVPIGRLAASLERLRQQGGDDRGRSSDSGRDRGSSGRSSSSTEMEPLVPGFGIEDPLPFPPGFGAEGELYSVQVEDEDRREADERFRRYDGNRDGVLDRDELRRGRWSDDPMTYDRNGDGKLTPSELAVRYAQRRNRESGGSSNGGSSSTAPRGLLTRSSTSSSSSGGTDPRMEGMVDRVLSMYDRNRNGVFDKDEWGNFRTDPSAADTNRDGKITRDEMSKWLASRFQGSGDRGRGGDDRGRGGGDRGDNSGGRSYFSSRGDSRDGSSRDDGGESDGRKSYRFLAATERLEEGLPDWFARNDADADGQVAMSEFSASWTAAVVNDFAQFDTNNDGYITQDECLTAAENGVVRGSTVSTASTNQTSQSSPTTSVARVASADSTSSTSSTPTTEAPSGVDPRFFRYYQGLVQKYDTSGDGVLTANEWQVMSRDPSSADTDGNSQITAEELAVWATKR